MGQGGAQVRGGRCHPDVPDGQKAGLPKTSELLAKALGVGQDARKLAGSAATHANIVTSALSLYLSVHFMTLRIDSSPLELERTKKKTYDGKEQKHRIQVITDTEGDTDDQNLAACLTSFGLNAFGVGFKLPEDGKGLAGVEVQFKEGTGFDRVVWGNYQQLRQVADDNGFVNLDILGRAQKVEIPDWAERWEADYSFFVESQVEEADAGSIANMFWSSLKAAAGGKVAGYVGPIIQQAKVMHWNLGEQPYIVVDWKPPGWRVTGAQEEAVFSGEICDLGKEFRLELGGGTMSGQLTSHPDKHYPYSRGHFDYGGAHQEGTLWGNGTYTVSGDPWTSLKLETTGTGCVTHALGKNCSDTQAELTLTPIRECGR